MTEDTRKIRSNTDARDDQGRFGIGNPGRPRGARNRVNAMAEAIIDDSLGEVATKCVELAMEGNTACVLALVRLRVPAVREASVQEPIELPTLQTPKDALAALRVVAEAVADGNIDGDYARSLVTAIEAFMKIFQVVDFDERLRALEACQQKENRRAAA